MTRKNETALVRRGNHALMRRTERPEEIVTPPADVFETGEAFIVRIDMPGAVRESIQVHVESGFLVVRGSTEELHQENARIVLNEIPRKSYHRKFGLTDGVRSDGIEAEFEDGVLTVVIPKSDDFKAREIRIL